jgi:hypothetical protein
MNYKVGAKGAMVKKIQQAVKCYPDGIFGRLTEEAVKVWQKEHGLTADGIVGVATLAKMFPAIFVLKKSRRKITDIVVHCTASKEGVPLTVERIREMHKANGWSDIGYHYVVDLYGDVHNGRDVDISGAHVSGHNAHSIGVVYVGGLDGGGKCKDTRTQAQKAALLSLLIDLKMMYPDAKISGHRDFSPDLNHNGIIEPKEWIKECPCFDAKKEYERL